MDLMEHVRRPMVDGVRMQVLNSQSEPVDGGTMCVTPFHLIVSTRRRAEDELTVSFLIDAVALLHVLTRGRYFIRPLTALSTRHSPPVQLCSSRISVESVSSIRVLRIVRTWSMHLRSCQSHVCTCSISIQTYMSITIIIMFVPITSNSCYYLWSTHTMYSDRSSDTC